MDYKNHSVLPVISAYKPVMNNRELEEFALQLRRDVIELTRFSGTKSSHVGGELSAADIIAVLYGAMLNLKPDEPEWGGRDVFVMSKGHCSAVMYAAMAWRGFFKREMLWNEFNQARGLLQEHCNLHLPGVEAATGSLGMGLANACGFAWSMLHDKQNNRRAYALLGDGECTEGQTWEGIGLAAQLKLDNLIAIVDYNKYIISSTTYEVMDLEPFEDRWRDFRWHVQRINGHDVTALREALETARDTAAAPGKPRVIICDTVKGKGIKFMEEDAFHWHAGHLDEGLYKKCLEELGL
jgi:transketolase